MASTGQTSLPQLPVPFFQICDFLRGAEVHRILGQQVPFATKGNQWVGYDDPESVKNKVGFAGSHTLEQRIGCIFQAAGVPSLDVWEWLGRGPRAQFPNTSPHLLHQVKYLKNKQLAGAMVWALDLDDFRGSFCGHNVHFPLTNAIKEALAVA